MGIGTGVIAADATRPLAGWPSRAEPRRRRRRARRPLPIRRRDEPGAAISQLVGGLVNEYLGSAPKPRTYLSENVVTVVLEDVLTEGERRLVRDGMSELVMSTRRAFAQTMRDDLMEGLEAITGRKVLFRANPDGDRDHGRGARAGGLPRCDCGRQRKLAAVAGAVTADTRLGVREEAHAGCHTLALAGELDITTSPMLESTIERLCDAGANEIVLDLHELSFIDSTGLRLILSGKQLCERSGCEFALTRARPTAQRLFEVTGLIGRLSFRGRALADRIIRRPPSAGSAPVDRTRPDFEASLDLNLDAPRSARRFVRELLDGTACERVVEVVMLLTSELVTPIVVQGTSVFMEAGELRVWLRDEVVRVELAVPRELLSPPPGLSGPSYEEKLFAGLADRSSIEPDGARARVWFEVDRDRSEDASTVQNVE